MPFIKSEFLIENPKLASINQRKELDKKEARRKAGLEEVNTHIKTTDKDPSLKYAEAPKIPSKTLLEK